MLADLTRQEVARLRRAFTNRLWILRDVLIYWDAPRHYLRARSASRVRVFLPPDTCAYVGRYSWPCDPQSFLSDLDDVIRKHSEG